MLHRTFDFQRIHIVTFIILSVLINHSAKVIAYTIPTINRLGFYTHKLSSIHIKMPRGQRKSTAVQLSNEDIANEKSDTQTMKRKGLPKDEPPTPGDDSQATTDSDTKQDAKPKRKKAAEPQRITEKDELPKLWNEKESSEKSGSYTFKIISWNVAGLRALLNNHPDALPSLVRRFNPDVICLQETKIQDIHVNDDKLNIQGNLLSKEGYESVFNCSIKKGYSGTAVIWKKWANTASPQISSAADIAKPDKKKSTTTATKGGKKQADIGQFFSKREPESSQETADPTQDRKSSIPLSSEIRRFDGDVPVEHLVPTAIYPNMGCPEHDQEGRVLTMDYPLFSLINVYVPNSGAELQRLSYRLDSWDNALLSFAKEKQKQRGKPVIWLGDLNVAHINWDCWNDGAKHLLKTPGTTTEEKESFTRVLNDDNGAFVDAFRFLHPTAKGWYTYWSQRAGNRLPNKGLRIDYFICSRDLMVDDGDNKVVVRDSYMISDQLGSDHCPIVLEMEIRK